MGSESPGPSEMASHHLVAPRLFSTGFPLGLFFFISSSLTQLAFPLLGSQKLFSIPASKLSPIPPLIHAGGGLLCCGLHRFCLLQPPRLHDWETPKDLWDFRQSGPAPSPPARRRARRSQREPRPSPPAFALLSHRVIFAAVE